TQWAQYYPVCARSSAGASGLAHEPARQRPEGASVGMPERHLDLVTADEETRGAPAETVGGQRDRDAEAEEQGRSRAEACHQLEWRAPPRRRRRPLTVCARA